MSKKTQKQSIDKNSIIRIVAVALVVVLIVSVAVVAFVRNAPKKYVDEDGNEHLLYIEEGNTVLNDDGRIVVYATDVNGDKVKDENGEPMTNSISFPQIVIKENVLETPYYKMTMPEAWELQEDGVYVYKENEEITLHIENLGEYSGNAEAFAKERVKPINDIFNAAKKEYPASTLTMSNGSITLKKINCCSVETTLCKTEDDILRYSNEIYFIFNDNAYMVMLNCENGSYNQIKNEINITDIVNANLAMKDKSVD